MRFQIFMGSRVLQWCPC